MWWIVGGVTLGTLAAVGLIVCYIVGLLEDYSEQHDDGNSNYPGS